MTRIVTSLLLSLLALPVVADVFGDSMPAEPAPVTLKDAIARLGSGQSLEDVKIRGQITEVYQKKGCWMILVDDDVYARVRFRDYSFFVPTDSASRQSVVLGTLTRRELSAKEAAHYEKDAGREPAERKATTEYAITASSVVIDPVGQAGS